MAYVMLPVCVDTALLSFHVTIISTSMTIIMQNFLCSLEYTFKVFLGSKIPSPLIQTP